MNWTERRERFRALLSGNRCVHPGSVYDAISARIAEDLGFEVGMFSGSIGSMSVLGAPDLVVLTLTEFAGEAYRICRAGNLALLVDADHGYGNALNVRRTVEELETAGICAMSIEDTVLPRPYGPIRRQAELELGRRGCGQDEGGAVGAPRSRTSSLPDALVRWRSPTSMRPSSGPRPMRGLGSTRSSSPAESRSRRSKRCHR
jgi:Phosphoenolpyruvate phosphomutase